MTSPKPSSPKKQPSDFAKYGSMATYMAVIITVGTFGGRWLDNNYPLTEKIPVYTLVLSLASVFAAMWYFIRDFVKKK
ncbi:MAG TPA: AtpZ/AtpI family protein [Bacteroidia bacterium]|nr:AtpZ/AtpI family protein [Bacteroidia bacterium]